MWQESLKLTKEIYLLTLKDNFSKDFSLRDQIRRAVISISSNIVEGFEKSNNNEFIRFLGIAKGPTGEVRNQLYIAQALEYISKNEFEEINQKFESLSRQISGFITYLNTKRKEGHFVNK